MKGAKKKKIVCVCVCCCEVLCEMLKIVRKGEKNPNECAERERVKENRKVMEYFTSNSISV